MGQGVFPSGKTLLCSALPYQMNKVGCSMVMAKVKYDSYEGIYYCEMCGQIVNEGDELCEMCNSDLDWEVDYEN